MEFLYANTCINLSDTNLIVSVCRMSQFPPVRGISSRNLLTDNLSWFLCKQMRIFALHVNHPFTGVFRSMSGIPTDFYDRDLATS